MVGSVSLPLWNIPLIIKIRRRKSSKDISLAWALGVWGGLLLMLPSGLVSADRVYKVFTVSNILLFSVVAFHVFRYRRGPEL